MKNALYCTILMAWLLQACTREECCPSYFQLPSQIVPQKQEYKVGDTIRLVSKFSRYVTAFNGEKTEIGAFDMEGIKWEPGTVILRIDTLGQAGFPSVSQNFTFLQDTVYDCELFTFSDGSNGILEEYNYNNDTFMLEVKLIAKVPGMFFLKQKSGIVAGHGAQQDFPGSCGRGGFDVWAKMNDGINNNEAFLKESPDEHWNTLIYSQLESQFYHVGGFCFKVIQ